MPFFEYSQNNSGGGFDHDPVAGIGYKVVVEADSDEQADAKAEEIGIYFNGCDAGIDCPCCGDRWSRAWGDGDAELVEPRAGWGLPAYVHFADGSMKTYQETTRA